MNKVIAPFLFIAIAVGLFFTYLDPAYKAVQALQLQESRLDKALTDSKSLQEKRASLLKRYADFSDSDVARLNKLLPDNVDNVRLVIDIDSIGASYNLTVRDYSFSTADQGGEQNPADVLGIARLSFGVQGSYRDFKAFLFDLESSLRLVDITSYSVTATPSGPTAEGARPGNTYVVALQTYWLK